MAKICINIDKIYGWGLNACGELGIGNMNEINSIIEIQRDDIARVFVNQNGSTGYLKNNGDLWMSGNNTAYGIFGDPLIPKTCHISPVQIPGKFICVSGNNMYSTGGTNMFLKQDNTLWASGYNGNGQLGQSNITIRSSMVQIPGTWISIGNGQGSSFGIKSDCTLWAWGYNGEGSLGTNSIISRSSPVQIPGNWICITGVSIPNTTFGIKSDCTLWTWGHNFYGIFGLSYPPSCFVSSPVQIPGTWIDISASSNHIAAIKSDCTLWIWGYNDCGQIGDNTNNHRSSPVQVPGTWISVGAGLQQTIAIKPDCTLWTWGSTPNGTLPVRSVSSPTQIPGNYTYISTGGRNSFAIAKINKEYNKNYNRGPFTINETYICSRGDNWSDFIPTIDD